MDALSEKRAKIMLLKLTHGETPSPQGITFSCPLTMRHLHLVWTYLSHVELSSSDGVVSSFLP